MDSQKTKDKCNQKNSIKFETEGIKLSFCDYSDAFIIVTGDIALNDTCVAFKNCALFSTCKKKINYLFIDEASHSYIAIPMYKLIEYSDDYLDKSGSKWQFTRDEVRKNNADLGVDDNGIFNSQSFK